MRWSLVMAAMLGSVVLALPAISQQVQRREPPAGQLKAGEVILVDDGRCPQGQVREVTGARQQKTRDSLASATSGSSRSRRCVQRPR
jgi:hypothetical protein